MAMIKAAGARCQLHGGTKYPPSRQAMLQVHHLDPDNYEDLNPEKFRVLCATCHNEIVEFMARQIVGAAYKAPDNFGLWYDLIGDFLPYKARKKAAEILGLEPREGEEKEGGLQMALIAKDSGGQDFETCPEGVFIGRLVHLVDMGTQESPFKDEDGSTRKTHTVKLGFELFGDEAVRQDGKPFIVYKDYTLALSKKSNFRKDLEAWRGKPLTEEEASGGYDLEKLIGQYAQIGVAHKTSKAGTVFAMISSISPLMKSVPRPAGIWETVIFSFENDDYLDSHAKLPGWLASKVEKADEWGSGVPI